MGSKNKSVSSNEKSQGGKVKKEKKEHTEKKDAEVFINEEQANKVVKSSKVITIQDLARQTNVKISTANAFLKKLHENGSVTRVGGFSGHHIYAPVSK